MHYWRGQSLKLHCGCAYLGAWKKPSRSCDPSPRLSHQSMGTKQNLFELICAAWLIASPRGGFVKTIRWGMLSRVSSCFALFFFGIHSLVKPTMLALLKRYRAVNTEYCKCYNYSCLALCFCDASQYSKLHCCNFSVMIISNLFYFFSNKRFFFFIQYGIWYKW